MEHVSMTEFEYLSVLTSIIFGLAFTHILTGSIRAIYARRLGEIHLVYTVFVLVLLVLNWWVAFSWRDHPQWSFDAFLLMVFWSIANFLMAITLYPPSTAGAADFDSHRSWFLWAFLFMGVFDIAQTAMQGSLFHPWYYLPFVGHYIVLALLGIRFKQPAFQRALGWWLLISILLWSLIVRRFVAPDLAA
jgi:hypothetical protein